MMPIPFINIHSHAKEIPADSITVSNISPGDPIPAFKGNNFYSVGLHPREIVSEKENNERMVMMEDALEFDHVIFVGECGIDKLAETGFDEQLRVFIAQAFMAEEYNKPLIIHCVRAWTEIAKQHKKMKPTVPWIFHGYNGSVELTRQFSNSRFLFSFGHNLFRESGKVVESFMALPLERIFFETDVHPGLIEEIYNHGAELKKLPLEILKSAVWENFNRLENVSVEI